MFERRRRYLTPQGNELAFPTRTLWDCHVYSHSGIPVSFPAVEQITQFRVLCLRIGVIEAAMLRPSHKYIVLNVQSHFRLASHAVFRLVRARTFPFQVDKPARVFVRERLLACNKILRYRRGLARYHVLPREFQKMSAFSAERTRQCFLLESVNYGVVEIFSAYLRFRVWFFCCVFSESCQVRVFNL